MFRAFPSRRSERTLRGTLITAVVVLAAASGRASAQEPTLASANARFDPTPYPTIISCDPTGDGTVARPIATRDDPARVVCTTWAPPAPGTDTWYRSQVAGAEASNERGYLRAAAGSAIYGGALPGTYEGSSALARTVWTDQLVVAPNPRVAFVDFTMRATGFLDAYVSPQHSAMVSASVSTGFSVARPDGYYDLDTFSYSVLVDRHHDCPRCSVREVASIDRLMNVRMPLIGNAGSTTLDLEMFLFAGVSTYDRNAAFYTAGGTLVNSAFDNSAMLSGLAFLDAAGQDITAEVTYRFANGTLIVPAVVPEPGTWALTGAGLLAVGATIARRKRAT